MKLSKAFGTVIHDLLLAKVHTHCVSKDALKLMSIVIDINEELLTGVLKGPVLGPLFFIYTSIIYCTL